MNARFLTALGALGLLLPGLARAEIVDFSYALSVSPQIVSGTRGVQASAEYSPSGTVSMSLGSTTEIIHEGGSYIPGSTIGPTVGGIYWYFRAPLGTPYGAPLGNVDTAADVKLSLTDLASGRSGQFDVAARFQGWAGGGGDYPEQPTFSPSPTTSQTLQLGNHLYHVLPSSLNDPGSIPEISPGFYLQFQVTVTSAVNAPEPSSLALAAVAGLGLVARRWRRGRSTAGEGR